MEMILLTTWALVYPEFDEADLKWLHGLGVGLNVDTPSHAFDTSDGRTHRVYGKPKIIIRSTSKIQDFMLELKYGNSIFKLSMEWIP